MSEKRVSKQRISIYLSFLLRHHPEAAGITLDEHGWANVSELLEGVSKRYPLGMDLLEQIVAEDSKQRYSFNESYIKIFSFIFLFHGKILRLVSFNDII